MRKYLNEFLTMAIIMLSGSLSIYLLSEVIQAWLKYFGK